MSNGHLNAHVAVFCNNDCLESNREIFIVSKYSKLTRIVIMMTIKNDDETLFNALWDNRF